MVAKQLREGPPVVYVPVVRPPWTSPLFPGIDSYARAADGDPRPIDVYTGKPLDRNTNTGAGTGAPSTPHGDR